MYQQHDVIIRKLKKKTPWLFRALFYGYSEPYFILVVDMGSTVKFLSVALRIESLYYDTWINKVLGFIILNPFQNQSLHSNFNS